MVLLVLSSLQWCSNASGGHEESCVRHTSWDFIGFVLVRVSLFWSTVIIIGDGCCSCAPVHPLGPQHDDFCPSTTQQALLWKVLPGSGDGGTRTTPRLCLVLVYVVVAWWSESNLLWHLQFALWFVHMWIAHEVAIAYQVYGLFFPSPHELHIELNDVI
jgi:hypothetical protein